jgi:hypothetical protein
MAIPTWVSSGAVSGAVSAITPALPASLATDDILFLVVQTRSGQAVSVANAAGGTWNLIGQPQDGQTPGNKLSLWWSRYNGTQTAPTTSDSGDHQVGGIVAYRGCLATGDPYEALVNTGNSGATADTTFTSTGLVTLGVDRRYVVFAGRSFDTAGAQYSAWTNADVANGSEDFDDGSTAGVGGGVAVWSAEKAAAGTIGATTATVAASTTDTWCELALLPVAGAPAAPVNTVAPVVSGTKTEGQTLTSTTGTFTGSPTPTYTYEWQRDDGGDLNYSSIGSATASTYLLVAADAGCNVRCVVTGTNASGSDSEPSQDYGLIGAAYTGSGTAGLIICGSGTGTFTPPDPGNTARSYGASAAVALVLARRRRRSL